VAASSPSTSVRFAGVASATRVPRRSPEFPVPPPSPALHSSPRPRVAASARSTQAHAPTVSRTSSKRVLTQVCIGSHAVGIRISKTDRTRSPYIAWYKKPEPLTRPGRRCAGRESLARRLWQQHPPGASADISCASPIVDRIELPTGNQPPRWQRLAELLPEASVIATGSRLSGAP
jgi:hypothetical protein